MTAPGGEGVLAEVLAGHRQQFRPQSGDSTCSCGQWEGPFTIVTDERAFGVHVAAEQAKALTEWVQQDEVVLRGAEGAFRDHTGRDIHEADETAVARQGDPYLVALWSGWSRAVLTAIFGSPS